MTTASSRSGVYTRRRALGIGAAGLGSLYIAACGGGTGAGTVPSNPRDVSLLYGFQAAGKPGGMQLYWESVREALAKSGTKARLAELSQIASGEVVGDRLTETEVEGRPTLATSDPNWFAYELQDAGLIVPLDRRVRSGSIDDWLLTTPISGKQLGAPLYINQALLVANRVHLAGAGVEVGERFGSWDEFMAACAKVKRSGQLPVIVGAADEWGARKWTQASSMAWMDSVKQLGESMIGELSVDEPVVSGWMDDIDQLRSDGYINEDAARITEIQSVERFLAGEGAFAIVPPGGVFGLDPAAFAIVGLWDGPGRYAAPVMAGANVVVMTSFGENKRAAGRILDFIEQPEQLGLLSDTTGLLPSNRRFDPGYLSEQPRRAWDLATKSSKPATWPYSYVPPYGPEVVARLAVEAFAGESPKRLRAEYRRQMEHFQTTNDIYALNKYLDSIEG